MRARVLVLGGGGFAGAALLRELGRRGAEVAAPRSAELDVRDAGAVLSRVVRDAPALVVNLAAAQGGAADAELRDVNVLGARAVAQAAARAAARLVHVSSDLVLDGRSPPYADDAPARPLTAYGRSKAAGEAAVRAAHPGALVVRTSLLWDPDALDRSTAGFAARLARGEACALYTDEVRCPLTRADLARAILDLAARGQAGLLNVAGRQAVSRHELGVRLLARFDVPGRERVTAARAADAEIRGAPPRPRDLRLVVTRAEALLGRRLPGLDDVLSGRRA